MTGWNADMLFTHHSHSGQFCTHATSSLEEVIQAAVKRGLSSIALTEHIPRDPEDHYPGEADLPILAGRDLWALFDAYYKEATRLREHYASQIEILIGFEGEWIRSPRSAEIIRELQAKYEFDIWIGSLHHTRTIPIDFTDEDYARARTAAGGSEADLWREYLDEQYQLIAEMKPPIIGHFDLPRLKGELAFWNGEAAGWTKEQERVTRNLKAVADYGGILEVNSAGLRKGLQDPYPMKPILLEFVALGGRLTLSDDSHGVDQLCTNYDEALDFLEATGIEKLCYFTRKHSNDTASTVKSGDVKIISCSLEQVRERMAAFSQ